MFAPIIIRMGYRIVQNEKGDIAALIDGIGGKTFKAGSVKANELAELAAISPTLSDDVFDDRFCEFLK